MQPGGLSERFLGHVLRGPNLADTQPEGNGYGALSRLRSRSAIGQSMTSPIGFDGHRAARSIA